ncbi:hypothetical protein L2E82_01983 [Cichorium intybus]|uniref:Uncharacterized protein n=1 Tax=Cichorium intybus TaxID=13427 RepID=A0ACB9H167_CICIN|nr:hypothetical protein L2E82_01983 [Cichorium intybus]
MQQSPDRPRQAETGQPPPYLYFGGVVGSKNKKFKVNLIFLHDPRESQTFPKSEITFTKILEKALPLSRIYFCYTLFITSETQSSRYKFKLSHLYFRSIFM